MNNKVAICNGWCRFVLKPAYRKYEQKHIDQIRNKY